jgi:hypothetical protein
MSGVVSPGTYSHEGFGRCGLYIDPSERFTAVYMIPGIRGFSAEAVVMPRSIMWSGLQ